MPTNDLHAQFLKLELDSGDPRRMKIALQEICKIYRSGGRLKDQIKYNIEITIGGLLNQTSLDLKVARWCLNAIGQFGRKDFSLRPVLNAIDRYQHLPEIAGAAVAALYKLDRLTLDTAKKLQILPREIVVLGALQNTDPTRIDLRDVRIDIQNASPDILKLSLITVGIDRAVEHLFDPKFSNAEVVRELGSHDDAIVMQYSVWAVLENPKLGVSDLGVNLAEFESLPGNVRSKIYHLMAGDASDQNRRHDYILRGSEDNHIEARAGLARGLKDCFYDGLETVTLDWFDDEPSRDVREMLVDHFARNSNYSPSYEDTVTTIFEDELHWRDRILGMSAQTRLYPKLRSIQYGGGTGNLFGVDLDKLSTSVPLLAKIPTPERSVLMNVLMLSANPFDGGRLRVDEEHREIKRQTRQASASTSLNVEAEFAVRIDELQGHLLRTRPDILHFSGHGSTGSSIVLEDNNGNSFEVGVEALTDLMELCKAHLKCVVLNSCYSDKQALAIAQHIDCVIGCNDTVADEAALTFSYAFYRALAHGEGFEQAYKYGLNQIGLTSSKSLASVYAIHLRSSNPA